MYIRGLLDLGKGIAYKYKRFVNGNEKAKIIEIRKYLTRNFILGEEKWTENNIQLRVYGNLRIVVNLDKYKIIDIFNSTNKCKCKYINKVEKRKLNKALQIIKGEYI